ncbi:lytic murein transglycosylase [Cellulomonas sp. C5510]|uniref:lytic murein transglycosylase n=1 Tax=Cellulomonas sp. C5510 TaxID=2871170 RepID=UPI001C94A53A|nr:lytic murein transglycosylase [Cellulomonas sp. C5510]QZN86853.1 lytic murein transglycosylase [Cellulomonas sp. C5510]
MTAPTTPDVWRPGWTRRVLLTVGLVLPLAGATIALELAPPPAPVALLSGDAPVMAALPGATRDDAAPGTAAVYHVDVLWAERIAARTGIPVRAVLAYGAADLAVDAEQPGCGLGWNTLAAIGSIESGHGSHGGAVLGDDGRSVPEIRGVPLDGDGVAAIPDTDDGTWDGDVVWDRAVGPMQFIPTTWARWGADADGDGISDPDVLDDAALAAARYLCADATMTTSEGWRAAVLTYNRSDEYADSVARIATEYARRAGAP